MADSGIDPGYGGFATTNKLLAQAGNGPDVANAWQQNAILHQRLSDDQYQLATKRFATLNGLLGSVASDPRMDNVEARIADAQAHNIISPDEAATARQEFAATNGDPAAIKTLAFRHMMTNGSIQQQMEAGGMAAPQYETNGQQKIPIQMQSGLNPSANPAGGPRIQMYQDPNSVAQPRDWVNSTGQKVQGTQNQYQGAVGDTTGLMPAGGDSLTMRGAPPANRLGPYMTPPAASPNSVIKPAPVGSRSSPNPITTGPAYAAPLPNGGTQNVDANGNAIGPNGQRNVAAANAPNVDQSGPGLAAPGPMFASGLKSYQDDLANATAKTQGTQPLLNALPLVRALGQTGSGIGTKPWQDMKSFLVSQGWIKADATNVDVRDEAQKYLKQYSARSGLAQRSDMGATMSEMSSPNLDTSQKATEKLIQTGIAADRMEAARPLAFGGTDYSSYGQHAAQWQSSQDQRAYSLDTMLPDQRAALVQDMRAKAYSSSKADQAVGRKFFASLKNAMKVMPAPGTSASPTPQGATDGQ